jgi:hypothetical protein
MMFPFAIYHSDFTIHNYQQLAWFKLALQIVERFGKSFSARFTKTRYKVSSKLIGFLNHAQQLFANVGA